MSAPPSGYFRINGKVSILDSRMFCCDLSEDADSEPYVSGTMIFFPNSLTRVWTSTSDAYENHNIDRSEKIVSSWFQSFNASKVTVDQSVAIENKGKLFKANFNFESNAR